MAATPSDIGSTSHRSDLLEIFESPEGWMANSCIIWGHGGIGANDSSKFELKDGVTIYFVEAEGLKTFCRVPSLMPIKKNLDKYDEAPTNYKLGTYPIRDYSKTEVIDYEVGRGPTTSHIALYSDIVQAMSTYSKLEKYKCPHVAILRWNAGFKTLRLSEIVESVRGKYSNVTKFFCGFCRSTF